MSRKQQEWVTAVLVRLTPEDLGALEAVGRSGEPRARTFRRLVHAAVVPADTLLRYRKPPLLPTWCEQGPLSVLAADERAQVMLGRGFDVELHPVAPAAVRPRWPDEPVHPDEVECEECGGLGADHEHDCPAWEAED